MKERVPSNKNWKERVSKKGPNDVADFVRQSGSTYDEKVKFLEEDFKETDQARNPDFGIKEGKQAVISSAREAYRKEAFMKRIQSKDAEKDRAAFEAEGLYYKRKVDMPSELLRGVDSELEKIVNQIPEEELAIDPEAPESEAEIIADQILEEQSSLDREKTIQFGTKEDDLVKKQQEIAKKKAEEVNKNPKNSPEDKKRVEDTPEEEQSSAGEEEKGYEEAESSSPKEGLSDDEEGAEKTKGSPEDESSKGGAETDKDDVPKTPSGLGLSGSYIEEVERKIIPIKKQLKDKKKKGLFENFDKNTYPVYKRAIEDVYKGKDGSVEKEKEITALNEWVEWQKKLVEINRSKDFEDYFSFRAERNIGGKAISQFRLESIRRNSLLDSTSSEIEVKRSKLSELRQKKQEAEKGGDKRAREKYSKEILIAKGELRDNINEEARAKKGRAYLGWAINYDERFRPERSFGGPSVGFARRRFNLKVYREIFSAKDSFGYLGMLLLSGVSFGIDKLLTKTRDIARDLMKNKLLDWSKFKPGNFLK